MIVSKCAVVSSCQTSIQKIYQRPSPEPLRSFFKVKIEVSLAPPKDCLRFYSFEFYDVTEQAEAGRMSVALDLDIKKKQIWTFLTGFWKELDWKFQILERGFEFNVLRQNLYIYSSIQKHFIVCFIPSFCRKIISPLAVSLILTGHRLAPILL